MDRDEIPIPAPCHESWDEMRPDGTKQRFCAKCAHAVVDLSAMTEREAKRLLARPPRAGLCVSYLVDDTGEIAFAPRRVRRLPTLPAVVGLSLAVAACSQQRIGGEPARVRPVASSEVDTTARLTGSAAPVDPPAPSAIAPPPANSIAPESSSTASVAAAASATPPAASCNTVRLHGVTARPAPFQRLGGKPMQPSVERSTKGTF